MALTIGTQLGSHEITALLGKGGMGEVYRARDMKLKREVAIKILPDEFSRDAERIARFQREAEALAALNHQNIAGIYDLQQSGSTRFLVLEFVEGDTLADILRKRGTLPLDESLNIAKQICEALEAAHEKGIIHRDLKPANVKITPDGKVKVLDFGLAKAMSGTAAATTLSNSPTLVSGSMGGVIVGTAAYMSPEQARGRDADQRSDVFAFGCVLYEMLTGRQAFQGEDVSDVLASVMKIDANLSLLPENLNPRLQESLRRCLAKNRRDRWHAIGDVRVELETILANPLGERVPPPVQIKPEKLWKRALPVIAAIALTFATTIALRKPQSQEPPGTARFAITLPDDQNFTNFGRHVLAISPDGAKVVYAANQRLYLRPLADTQIRQIPGAESERGITTPFFSPDGQWVGFYDVANQQLKKVAVTGGPAITLCKLSDNPFGASWADDRIFIGQGARGILSVTANGGEPQPVVTLQPGQAAADPQAIGNGMLLFSLANGIVRERWDKAQIIVQSLKSGERKVIFENGADARYLPTGHIVYALGSTLFAFSFDVKKLQVTGSVAPILEGVARTGTGESQFSVSSTGALVYVGDFTGLEPRGERGSRVLAFVDRSGKRNPIQLPPGLYDHPRLSPDGKQLAVALQDATGQNIWIYDLTGTGSPRRLTFGGDNSRPIWTPDGQRVTFVSDREGTDAIYWQRADGSGPAERLVKEELGRTLQSESWSPDEKALTYGVNPNSATVASIWSASPGSGQPPKPLIEIRGSSATNSSFSPDGRWIAYGSNEAGRLQVYVQPFPITGAKYQISTLGSNHHPVWSPKGGQLFYMSDQPRGTGQLFSVDIQTQPRFVIGKPTPLPIEGIVSIGPRAFDITHDGNAFVVMFPVEQADAGKAPPAQINVALNWFRELEQRVPVK